MSVTYWISVECTVFRGWEWWLLAFIYGLQWTCRLQRGQSLWTILHFSIDSWWGMHSKRSSVHATYTHMLVLSAINLKPRLRPNGGLEDNTFTWLYYKRLTSRVTTERVLNLEISWIDALVVASGYYKLEIFFNWRYSALLHQSHDPSHRKIRV